MRGRIAPVDAGQQPGGIGPETVRLRPSILPSGSPILVTVLRAAQELSVSTNTICRLIKSGDLPYVRVRSAVRVRMADLTEYADRHASTRRGHDLLAEGSPTVDRESGWSNQIEPYQTGRARTTPITYVREGWTPELIDQASGLPPRMAG